MATTYDKASLVMLPSGYKDDKLYSVKPTDGSGDFTFSRDGSGASPATRVNASGYIEKGRTNEVLYSNDFSGATWVPTFVTRTTGFSDPFGGTTAVKFLETTPNGEHRVFNSFETQEYNVYTQSVYVKPIGRDQMLYGAQSNSVNFLYDFTTESFVSTNGSPIDYGVESVGGGWYRFYLTYSVSGNFNHSFIQGAVGGATTYVGDVTKGFYTYGAQLEAGLVATDYIETTTTAVSAGLLGDMPRLDYSGGATCPSLLLEPSRVNSVPHSEYVSAMTLSNISATANATTSPEGVGNAYEVEPTGTGFKTIGNFVSITAGQKYTISFFYKNVDHKNIGFYDNNTSGSEIQINVQDNTFTLGASCDAGDVEDYGNGWYRAWCTFTASNSTLANYLIFRNDSNSGSYTATGSSIYVYGFQVEQGSYPTSYIPTYGSASGRAGDDCDVTGITNLIGQTSGGVFLDFEYNNFESGYDYFGFSDGTGSNRLMLGVSDSSTQGYRLFVVNGGATSIDSKAGDTTDYGRKKVFVKYDNGSYKVFVNGSKIIDTTGASSFSASLTSYHFSVPVSSPFYSPVNQTLLFTSALTDSEAIALTTI